eukprot:gene4661-4854_t
MAPVIPEMQSASSLRYLIAECPITRQQLDTLQSAALVVMESIVRAGPRQMADNGLNSVPQYGLLKTLTTLEMVSLSQLMEDLLMSDAAMAWVDSALHLYTESFTGSIGFVPAGQLQGVEPDHGQALLEVLTELLRTRACRASTLCKFVDSNLLDQSKSQAAFYFHQSRSTALSTNDGDAVLMLLDGLALSMATLLPIDGHQNTENKDRTIAMHVLRTVANGFRSSRQPLGMFSLVEDSNSAQIWQLNNSILADGAQAIKANFGTTAPSTVLDVVSKFISTDHHSRLGRKPVKVLSPIISTSVFQLFGSEIQIAAIPPLLLDVSSEDPQLRNFVQADFSRESNIGIGWCGVFVVEPRLGWFDAETDAGNFQPFRCHNPSDVRAFEDLAAVPPAPGPRVTLTGVEGSALKAKVLEDTTDKQNPHPACTTTETAPTGTRI